MKSSLQYEEVHDHSSLINWSLNVMAVNDCNISELSSEKSEKLSQVVFVKEKDAIIHRSAKFPLFYNTRE